jgi:hypothetical protein
MSIYVDWRTTSHPFGRYWFAVDRVVVVKPQNVLQLHLRILRLVNLKILRLVNFRILRLVHRTMELGLVNLEKDVFNIDKQHFI